MIRSGWFWLAVLAIAGAGGFFGALGLYNRWMLERDLDHLFHHVLADGDAGAAYKRSDATFQAVVPWPEFFAAAQAHPHWFERDKLKPVEVAWMKHQGALYVVMKTRVDGGAVGFYCKPGERGDWRLAGIAPGLTVALPRDLKQVSLRNTWGMRKR